MEKLELLTQLSQDVKDQRASLEFSQATIDVLKKDNASLRMDLNCLKQQVTDLQYENFHLSKDVLDMQCRSMRDNVIIHGIPEKGKETYMETEQLVKSFLKDSFQLEEKEVDAIHFSRAHCIGQSRHGMLRPRPVVAKLTDSKAKLVIMGKGKRLKDTPFSISDQFPPEILRRRRLLYPVMRDARNAMKRTCLSVDKLYIDGKLFRNSDITYWLSGGDENWGSRQTEAQPPLRDALPTANLASAGSSSPSAPTPNPTAR